MSISKRPWRRVSVRGGWDGIADPDGTTVCRLVLNEPDNADFIVRAVNAHDDLLFAAKEAAIVIGEIAKLGKTDWMTGTVFPRLMAAIAKAEGK